MKITYLHQYFATPLCNGGTRSYEMAKRLTQQGHQVTFVTSSAFLEHAYNLNEGWNELSIDGIIIHAYHLPYSNNDSFSSRILKFIKFATVSTKKVFSLECDLIFATSTPLTIAIPALVYKKIKRKPMVFEVRDLWPEVPIAIGAIKNKFIIKALRYFEKIVYRNSSQVIALSSGMRDGVLRYGYNINQTHIIPNSCDNEIFDIPKEIGVNYKNEKLPFVGSRKLVVYAGTFGLINGVSYIADLAYAAKNINSNVCFIAIGNGMYKEQVITKAKELRVYQDNLFILDAIPKNEVVKLCSASDLCLSLVGPIKETWHNSANKIFDSLAARTPIGINYGGWQKDLIEKTKCGVVLTDDFTQSAKDLKAFLNNKEKYELAVNACVELSHGEFSRDKLFEKFERVLQKALK